MDSIFYIYLFVLLPLMVGMMFVPMNVVYGIRCPWSMYSENTWRIVHKYGGYMGAILFAAAFPAIFTGLIGMHYNIFVLIVGLCAGALIFSYFVYKSEKHGANYNSRTVGLLGGNLAMASVSIVLSLAVLLCLNYQSAAMEPFCGSKIATHFNAKGVADGWMKAEAFFGDFLAFQALGGALSAATAFGLVWFTAEVFDKNGNIAGKLLTSLAAFLSGTASIVFYYTGIIASVAVVNSCEGGSREIEFFASPAIGFISAAFFLNAIFLPFLLIFRALRNLKAGGEFNCHVGGKKNVDKPKLEFKF